MKYGLSDETRASMDAIFLKHPKIDNVILYGSRAKGTHHEGSDIDLTLVGNELELADLYAVDETLDELNLPYTIDLSLYGQIDNAGLIGHIERRGETFYQKNNNLFIQIKLSECCQIKPPKSEAKKALSEDELVSFVPMKNLGIDSKKVLLDSTRKLSEVSSSYTYFADNDVLLAKITPCFENGKLGIARELQNGIGFGSSEFIVFRPNTKLLSEYLYYFLLRPSFRDDGKKVMTGAVGHKRVPKDFIENTEIPLPPINEQKRIVAILDQAFTEIEKARINAEQNLKNARELFESYLQQVFSQGGDGWKYKAVSEVTTKLGDGLHGTPKYSDNGGYYFINGNNLNDGKIVFKERTKKVTIEEYDKYKKILNNRTVLVSINGTLGNVAFYNNEKIILGKSACYFNLIEGINKQYVKYVIESPLFQNYVEKVATGATIKNVSLKSMREFIVPIAPITTQQSIVNQLNGLKLNCLKLENIYQQKLDILDELKKSILQKAFTGELTKAK